MSDLLGIHERLETPAPAGARLSLPYELRRKSRLRARLDDGTEVGIVLPRGTVLRGGDRLRADDGRVIEVVAADEKVSTVHAGAAGILARACYHLGNRHVAVQIGEGWARYLHDHVLDEMLVAMGLEVEVGVASFEPESGAYGEHAHAQDHGHQHDG